MEMNDILNGLNSCEDDCSDSRTDSCSCGPSFGCSGIGGFPGGFGQNLNGCGFGSWIWILLILFYCGCGRNFGRGRYNNNCCCEKKHDCGCERGGGYGGGLFANCSSYLFLLVILFLCNTNNGKAGFGGIGSNIGCGTC